MNPLATTPVVSLPEAGGGAGRRYTMRQYRMLAKILHWLTAGLVVLLVSSAVLMKQLGDGPAADFLYTLHKSTGVLTLFVVLIRLGYRATGRERGWRAASHRRPILHWILYGAIVLVPLLGWAGVSDFGARALFFGYSLPAIWPEGAGYSDLLLGLHTYLAFGLLALVALHIGVALQDYLMRSNADGAASDSTTQG